MNDDLDYRLRRLYAAIGETQERDLAKISATVISNEKGILIHQDFSGGKTDEQLMNAIQSLIALIASLEYFLYKWADKNGYDRNKVKQQLQSSHSFSIVHALWNNEKHGYPPRPNDDRTGLAPQLLNVNRVMRVATQAKKGSSVVFRLGQGGKSLVSGNGTAKAIITGDVVAKDGKQLGDAHAILETTGA
jgi:hypothetical protein